MIVPTYIYTYLHTYVFADMLIYIYYTYLHRCLILLWQIEDVMENETYKKATEILEKYAPNRLHKLNEVCNEVYLAVVGRCVSLIVLQNGA